MSRERCSSCGAAVVWVVTLRGRRMPLDAQPTVGGTIQLDHGVATHLTGDALVLARRQVAEGRGALWTSHFATCPNAAAHRRRP